MGNASTSAVVVGVDVGDRWSHFCVLEMASGRRLQECRVKTTPAAIREWFGGRDRMRVALEAGMHSSWLSRLLAELGHEVLVANPRKLRLVYENRKKCDRVDAEQLARLARVDPRLLHPVHHRGEQEQADQTLVRSRAALVKCRTELINHCRGVVKTMGSRLPSADARTFAAKARLAMPEALRENLEPLLQSIEVLTQHIRSLGKRVEAVSAERYPATAILRQVHGVGAVTALSFVLKLQTPQRFGRSRQVGAYLGLVPARDESGESRPQLGITHEGDPYLRKLLVQCAQYMLGPFGEECDLRRYGERLIARGGKAAKRRAVVAVARKLAVLLHRLWRSGAAYDPNHAAHRMAA